MSADVVHRLGTAVAAAGILGLSAWWIEALRRRRGTRRRMAHLLRKASHQEHRERADPRLSAPAALRTWGPVSAVAAAGWVLIGGLSGILVGLAAAAGLRWWQRRIARRPEAEFDVAEAARRLPLAADLVAACIAAGAGPVIAAQAVGEALGGPVGEALTHGAAEVRLGGAPNGAWSRLAAIPGAAALARLLERADESGLPAAGPAGRLAADVRAERARAATARARRAAVLVTAPVGLCFLPAFVAVGVLPVVIGLAGGVLKGGGGW
ncbi:type II secretion system F family protein [Streptomyces mexicanus]|uniref:Type II secretion system F family protein n=1 Tax=Streptomyces mexicanus TaxID=178566 RepID=A0A7X1HZI2_9ACTN|nr:type II secretion system F family protein [Streptomyces mexicanus]MBC2863803.1 type II secretion system F family protein [Streptomyces mexicanus]